MKPEQSIMPEREPVRLEPRKAFTPKQRAEILLANGGRCYLSGVKIGAGDAWDVEHVIPLAQGGTNDPANLKPALTDPHKAKSARDAANTAKAKRLAGETCAAKPARPLQSRGFDNRTRKFDGSVGPTRKALRQAANDEAGLAGYRGSDAPDPSTPGTENAGE